MSEPQDTTKVEDKKGTAESAEAGDLLSADALDAIIAEADPEFAQSLETLNTGEPMVVVDDDGIALTFTLEDEVRFWKETEGWRGKWVRYLPFLPIIAFKVKIFRTSLRLGLRKLKERSIHGLKSAGPAMAKGLKGAVGGLKDSVGDGLHAFKEYSLKKKLLFVGLIFVTGAGSFLVFKMATRSLIPPEEELFLGSLADWAGEKYTYVPHVEVESFYESTRTQQNILLLKRMVVNLKRSPESGDNPMGAFEFLAEGTVSEVVVEIKDREAEILDLIVRTIEEMSYDQVSSGEGKRLLCDRLRTEINKVLTKGHVRRVFIKNAVIKP